MKMERIFISIVIVTLFAAASCSDDPYVNMPEPDDMIVVDGWIESGQYAKVLLTRNMPYLSSLDSASIREMVLTRAKVTLSDGERNEILILRRNTDYFPPFVYEGNEIKGETGKTYTIKAEYGGRTAYGSTTIPSLVILDTLYFALKEDSDSLGWLYAGFTDPPGNNYYRVLTKLKGADSMYYSSFVMGLSDEYFSGRKFGITIGRGRKSYLAAADEEYFCRGDTVLIKFCTIDKAHYEFWNSYQDEVMNAGNPFASSVSVIKSNIQGNGLGIWGGYGVSQYTLIIR